MKKLNTPTSDFRTILCVTFLTWHFHGISLHGGAPHGLVWRKLIPLRYGWPATWKPPYFTVCLLSQLLNNKPAWKNAEGRQKGGANSVTLKVERVWHGRTWTQWKIGGHCRQCTSLTHFYIIDPRLQLGVEAGRCPPFNFSPTNLESGQKYEFHEIMGRSSHLRGAKSWTRFHLFKKTPTLANNR